MEFGHIHNCYIINNPELNCNRNYGFVEFEDPGVAEYLLVSKVPLIICGLRVHVHPFKEKGKVIQDTQAYSVPAHAKKSKAQAIKESFAGNLIPKNSSNFQNAPFANPQEECSNATNHRRQHSSQRNHLGFGQRHPAKGKSAADLSGGNYHLRISATAATVLSKSTSKSFRSTAPWRKATGYPK